MLTMKCLFFFLSANFFPLGTVLLDLEKFDLPSIAQAVVENMVDTEQLKQKDSNKVLTALLLRHRHQHQQGSVSRRASSKKRRKLVVGAESLGFNAQTETGNGVIRLNMNESKDGVQKNQVCHFVRMLKPLVSDDTHPFGSSNSFVLNITHLYCFQDLVHCFYCLFYCFLGQSSLAFW